MQVIYGQLEAGGRPDWARSRAGAWVSTTAREMVAARAGGAARLADSTVVVAPSGEAYRARGRGLWPRLLNFLFTLRIHGEEDVRVHVRLTRQAAGSGGGGRPLRGQVTFGDANASGGRRSRRMLQARGTLFFAVSPEIVLPCLLARGEAEAYGCSAGMAEPGHIRWPDGGGAAVDVGQRHLFWQHWWPGADDHAVPTAAAVLEWAEDVVGGRCLLPAGAQLAVLRHALSGALPRLDTATARAVRDADAALRTEAAERALGAAEQAVRRAVERAAGGVAAAAADEGAGIGRVYVGNVRHGAPAGFEAERADRRTPLGNPIRLTDEEDEEERCRVCDASDAYYACVMQADLASLCPRGSRLDPRFVAGAGGESEAADGEEGVASGVHTPQRTEQALSALAVRLAEGQSIALLCHCRPRYGRCHADGVAREVLRRARVHESQVVIRES